MAIKRMELSVKGTKTLQNTWETIKEVAASGKSDSPKTCWNVVGLYLHQHPQTIGVVVFYGSPGPTTPELDEIVAHVILVDSHKRVLADSQASGGGRAVNDLKLYDSPSGGGGELHVRIGQKTWPPKD
jgi:hypothetical protein